MRRWLRSTLPVFALCAAARPAHGAGRERAGQGRPSPTPSPSGRARPTSPALTPTRIRSSSRSGWDGAETVSSTAPWPTSTTRRRRPTTSGSRLAQFHARFSPSASDVAAVRRWLSSEGFSIVDVPANRLFVAAEGSVAQVEQAFDVDENMYRVDGSVLRAPNHDPVVPAAVAPLVSAITGLDGAMTLAHPNVDTPPPPPAGTSVGPCSSYWGQRTSSAFTNPYGSGPAALAHLRLPAVADQLGVRDRPAARRRARRPRADDRDHRRVLLADDPPGRRALLAPLPPGSRSRLPPPRLARLRLPRDRRAGDAAVPEEPGRDAELVHRAGARRRVGTRGRAAGEDRLRRRRQRRPRARPGPELRGRQRTSPTSSRTRGACPRRSSRAARSWR